MEHTARGFSRQDTVELQALAPGASLLERLQIRPGANVLHLGFPEPGCLGSLAGQVGPSGTINVVDGDARAIAAARRFVIDRNLANVEVLGCASWHDLFEPQSFDVVHIHDRLAALARRRRRRIVRRATHLVRPGGWVVSPERRSALDRSPWTVIGLFSACGLALVSTEPAHDGAFDRQADDGAHEYLVWGRKAAW